MLAAKHKQKKNLDLPVWPLHRCGYGFNQNRVVMVSTKTPWSSLTFLKKMV